MSKSWISLIEVMKYTIGKNKIGAPNMHNFGTIFIFDIVLSIIIERPIKKRSKN